MMNEFLYILLTTSLCLNIGLFRSYRKANREIAIAASIIMKERRSRDIDVKQKIAKTILSQN